MRQYSVTEFRLQWKDLDSLCTRNDSHAVCETSACTCLRVSMRAGALPQRTQVWPVWVALYPCSHLHLWVPEVGEFFKAEQAYWPSLAKRGGGQKSRLTEQCYVSLWFAVSKLLPTHAKGCLKWAYTCFHSSSHLSNFTRFGAFFSFASLFLAHVVLNKQHIQVKERGVC